MAVGAVLSVFVITPQVQAAPVRTTTSSSQDLAQLSTALEKRLGARTAGSYLDPATKRLTVTVTDASAAQSVRSAGADAKLVLRSKADLAKATDTLNRSARVPGTAWGVDPASNQVVVSVDESVTGAELAKVKSVAGTLGGAVRVESIKGTLQPAATMLNGSAIWGGNSRCSLGFSVFPIGQKGLPGPKYFLTAGHCVAIASTWYADSGHSSLLGVSNRPFSNGPAGDYGIVEYTGAGISIYGTVAGTNQFISRPDNAFVGEAVRRSGSTTGVHSGTVTALNQTVNYVNGVTVNG